MSAADIARSLGGKREGNNYRCRCPLCGGALIVSEPHGAMRNPLLHCFGSECGQNELVAWAKSKRLWTTRSPVYYSSPAVKSEILPEKTSQTKRQRALATYDNAGVAPVITRRYLRNRGITIAPPPALRLASQLWHPFEKAEADAIVGLVEHAEKGRVGLHAIYLDETNTRKADFHPPKLTFGPVAGGAIHLAEADPNNWLIIGEGVETVLSAMQIMDKPGWAALGTAGVQNLVLPDSIKKVWIAADHDAHGAGQRAAHAAADRFVAEGRQVRVSIPTTKGTDWNDVLMEQVDGQRTRTVREAGERP
jgi:putative DNA primase/helicase